MPPETLLLSVVAEQPDSFQDICKASARNVTTGTTVVAAEAVYSQFTLERWRLTKGSGQRRTRFLVNKMKGRVGFRYCV